MALGKDWKYIPEIRKTFYSLLLTTLITLALINYSFPFNSQDGKRVDDICENAAYELTTASNDGSNIKMMSTYNTLLQNFSKVLHPNHYISKELSIRLMFF